MSQKSKLKVWEIIPGSLFQSPQFWRESVEFKKRELRRFDSVICLTKVRDQETASLFGDYYLYLHIPDGKGFDTSLILSNALKVGDWMEEGKKVLVHCQAGRNRSSLFSALLVVRLMKVNGIESISYMRERRKGALGNDCFVKFLSSVERYSPILGSYVIKGEIE